jgi:hypothetical protein
MRTLAKGLCLLLTGLALPTAHAFDFGDAPAPFPTTLADDGARHPIPAMVWLGANGPDDEGDGVPDAQAEGDDLALIDDEDGVVFPASLPVGGVATAQVTASGACLLSAWIDFDGDGSWTGAAEQVAADLPLVAGPQPLVFNVPVQTVAGALMARFRVSIAGGLGFTGAAPDGEVEDYQVEASGSGYDYGDARAGSRLPKPTSARAIPCPRACGWALRARMRRRMANPRPPRMPTTWAAATMRTAWSHPPCSGSAPPPR